MKKLTVLLFIAALCGCKDPGAWMAFSNGFQQGVNNQQQVNYGVYQPPAIAAPTAPTTVYTERAFETYISGDFNGWDGETVWKMDNDQIWQQAQYSYHYAYRYHPKVLIWYTSSGWKMRVEGETTDLLVKRIR